MKKNINFNHCFLFLLISVTLVPVSHIVASESSYKGKLTWAAVTTAVGMSALAYRAYSHRRDASRRIDRVTDVFENNTPELKTLTAVDESDRHEYPSVSTICNRLRLGRIIVAEATDKRCKEVLKSVNQRATLVARMYGLGNYQAKCVERFVGLINKDYKAPTEPSRFDGVPVFDELPRLDSFPVFDCSPAPSWLDTPLLFGFQRRKLENELADQEVLEVSKEEEEYTIFTALRCTTKLAAVLGWSLPKFAISLGWSCTKYIGSLGVSSTKYLGLLGCSSVKYGLQNGLHSIRYPADSIVRNDRFITEWPEKFQRWERVKGILENPNNQNSIESYQTNFVHPARFPRYRPID